LAYAAGLALAAKRKNFSWRTFVLLSDGELDEGSNWESLLFAPHHRLDNLTVIIDYNKIQSLGDVEGVLGLEPLAAKFQAFNWAVRVIDGHSHDALVGALGSVPWEPGRPSAVIGHTVKGKGVSFMEGRLAWHYRSPTNEELVAALSEIG
jgi:transketolase